MSLCLIKWHAAGPVCREGKGKMRDGEAMRRGRGDEERRGGDEKGEGG